METKGFEKDEWSLFSFRYRLFIFQNHKNEQWRSRLSKEENSYFPFTFPWQTFGNRKKVWQVSQIKTECFVYVCTSTDESERNNVIEPVAFVSLGNRCTLIFWSCMTPDCPTAEGRMNTYALIISGMVTMRYFIYDKVLWNAFLLLETCFFCYYRTQCFINCRHNSFIIQLHVDGTSNLIQLMWVFLGHFNWWF